MLHKFPLCLGWPCPVFRRPLSRATEGWGRQWYAERAPIQCPMTVTDSSKPRPSSLVCPAVCVQPPQFQIMSVATGQHHRTPKGGQWRYHLRPLTPSHPTQRPSTGQHDHGLHLLSAHVVYKGKSELLSSIITMLYWSKKYCWENLTLAFLTISYVVVYIVHILMKWQAKRKCTMYSEFLQL